MPYYFKHFMWLDKNEWDKLKARANPPNTPRVGEDPYIKDLIEKSQKWIRSWPDSVEGHVDRFKKEVHKDHDKEIAEVKAFIKQRKHDDSKQALAKARQLIFERSSNGKQLLSALVASKVIDEREIQIAFKKQIEKDHLELEKRRNQEDLYFIKTDQNEQERLRKKKNVLFALENKNMYETQAEKVKIDKEEKARLEREDAALMQELLNREKREEKEYLKNQEELIKQYEQDVFEFRMAKMKRENENEKKIGKAKKDIDRRVLKIKKLQQHYNTAKLESEVTKLNYKLIERIENEKRKRFEDFVEIGIKRHEDAVLKKEQDEFTRQKNKQEVKNTLRKQQQIAVKEWKQSRCDRETCTCDRQCVLARSLGERRPNKVKLMTRDEPKPKSIVKKLQFLTPQKKLTDELRQRQQEPTPWTGMSGAHAQFAEHAARTLTECKHKTMARKVVNEYRKLNSLNATTLPIKNIEC